MEVTVQVDGRGHGFKVQMFVDPKDKLESSMKSKVHFWKQFMGGSQ